MFSRLIVKEAVDDTARKMFDRAEIENENFQRCSMGLGWNFVRFCVSIAGKITVRFARS